MEWLNRSETLFGKVLAGEISPHAIEPEILHPPFDAGLRKLRDGGSEADLLDVVGIVALSGARAAAENVTADVNTYVAACRESARRVRAGTKLAPIVKRWSAGESQDGDYERALEALNEVQTDIVITRSLADVEPEEAVFVPTFYPPLDDNCRGLPASSLTVIGGPPGTGKTIFLGRLMISAVRRGKRVWLASLEMSASQILYRFIQLDETMSHMTKRERVLVAERALTLSEIYSEGMRMANTYPDLYMIGVDFADMILPSWRTRGDNGVDVIDETYKQLAALAKLTGIPVVVLSQLNYQYVGGRPRVNHLRGSRLIEALGASVFLIYNPNQLDVDQSDDELGFLGENRAALIHGKARYGYKYGGPIAIPIEWDGEKGWGEKYDQPIRLYSA